MAVCCAQYSCTELCANHFQSLVSSPVYLIRNLLPEHNRQHRHSEKNSANTLTYHMHIILRNGWPELRRERVIA